MKQPAGTRTYKGNRASKPGEESFEKDQKVLEKSGSFHSKGKEDEKKFKDSLKKKKTEAAAPVKSTAPASSEGSDK